jgi:hypothetical protein
MFILAWTPHAESESYSVSFRRRKGKADPIFIQKQHDGGASEVTKTPTPPAELTSTEPVFGQLASRSNFPNR